MTKYSLPYPLPLKNPHSPFRSFNYIRPIQIKGSNKDLRDYQVKIVLNRNNFPLEKCKPDGSDIRFRDETGEALPYWIESWTPDEAVVWCKIPFIPACRTKDIWIIYGNPSASSASDGKATFDFFDDFEPEPAYTLKGIVEAGAIENTPIGIQNFTQAIHYKKNHDRTYFLYISDSFEHRILYFDHDTKSWSSSVKVADCVENDLHENGAIAIDNDGYIYVFYNAHANMRVKKSTNPEDITSWGSAIDPTDGWAAYPKTFVDSSNTIYLLHMHHANISPDELVITKSTDGGNTWASETVLVDLGSNYNCYAFKALLDPLENIHVVFSIYVESQHRRRGVYYMKSTDGGSTWQKADGTPIPIPAGEGDVDEAYAGSSAFNQGFDLVLDGNNYPIIAYSDAKVYGIVRWNGSSWESHSLGVATDNEFNNIRLQVINDTTYRAWLFTDASMAGRGGELQIWETTDNGVHWVKIEDVTKNSSLLHRGVLIPWDYTQEVEAIWNYGNWTDENGPDCDILFYGTASPVFYKEMTTASIDNEAEGSFKIVDGTYLDSADIGSGSQWHGPRGYSDLAYPLSDFEAKAKIKQTVSTSGLERIGVYLCDINGNIVYFFYLGDNWGSEAESISSLLEGGGTDYESNVPSGSTTLYDSYAEGLRNVWNDGEWVFKLSRVGSNLYYSYDDNLLWSGTTGISTAIKKIKWAIMGYTTNPEITTHMFDYIMVRKYTSPEPVVIV